MAPTAVVYVLHRRNGPRQNLAKVGSTRVSADSRAAKYTDGGWEAFFMMDLPAHIRFAVERKSYSILAEQGFWLDPNINGGTANEIFTCTPQQARDAIISAVDIIKSELYDFIDGEIALELAEYKRKVIELNEDLKVLNKIKRDNYLANNAHKIINEAEHVKKLQDRIRALDKLPLEKNREIDRLSSDLSRFKSENEFPRVGRHVKRNR